MRNLERVNMLILLDFEIRIHKALLPIQPHLLHNLPKLLMKVIVHTRIGHPTRSSELADIHNFLHFCIDHIDRNEKGTKIINLPK